MSRALDERSREHRKHEEIHALCERRDRATVDTFLTQFARGLIETSDEYRYPESVAASAGTDLGSLDAAISFLLADPSRAYALYWSGRRSVSLHFLSDGSLIAAALRDDGRNLEPELREFVDYLGARWVLAEGAVRPIESAAEFRRVARRRRWAIADGVEVWPASESA